MKKIFSLISLFVLLLSFVFVPIDNAHAEKVTYKWGKITFKEDHIGKIIVKKNTSLYNWDSKKDKLTKINTLKKGEERPIYSTRDSEKYGELLSIGNSQLVKNNKNVTYKKPTQHMKETVGKQRVWLWKPFDMYDSKGKSVYIQNLTEAIILSREKTDFENWYELEFKIGSKYYIMKDVDAGDGQEYGIDYIDDEYYYLTRNPFKQYAYDKKTWDLIKGEKIKVGMDDNQVILSWGSPTDRNTYESSNGSITQWIYGDTLKKATYLYFVDHELVSWEKY